MYFLIRWLCHIDENSQHAIQAMHNEKSTFTIELFEKRLYRFFIVWFRVASYESISMCLWINVYPMINHKKLYRKKAGSKENRETSTAKSIEYVDGMSK